MNLNPKPVIADAKRSLEQPIDLAHKTLLTTSNINPVTNQTLQIPSSHAVNIHPSNVIDGTKLNFTTLKMPIGPRLTVGGSVPILPTSASTQILTSKSIVRPSAEQAHVTTTVISHGSPSGPRHVKTAVVPVMSLASNAGSTPVPMASIIRGAHALPQNMPTHPSGTLYSSHVPRGPAAVASISAGPKSAVATPMLRPTGVTTVARAATLVNRTAVGTLSKTISSPGVTQVMDNLHRLATPGSGHAASVQLSFPSGRVFDAASIRTAGGKPLHISQPIVHQVQQIGDKSYYKPAGTAILTAGPGHLLSQGSMPGSTTGSLTPVALSTANNQPNRTIPSTCVVTIAPGSTIRTTGTQQLVPQGGSVIGSHQTLTVVSGKSIGHVVTTGGQHGTITVPPGHHLKVTEIAGIKKIVAPSGNQPVTQTVGQPRVVQAAPPSATGLPVAKVYPQPLSSPRTASDSGTQESPRGNIFIAHAPQNIAVSNAAGMSTTVVLSDNLTDSGPIRFASIPRPASASGTPYAVQPTAYYYESYQVQNTIAMHPYPAGVATSSNQTFTTTTLASPLRPSSMPAYVPPQQAAQLLHSNHNTSPRPSILRKRTLDGPLSSVKKNLSAMAISEPVSPVPPPILSNIASTSSATSPRTTSTPPRAHSESSKENGCANTEVIEKHVIMKQDTVEVHKSKKSHVSSNGPQQPVVEASPRKKPRKQQLAANELLESNSMDEDYFQRKIREIERKERELLLQKALAEEESAKWVTFCKRPSMSLLQSYRHTWKSRHNHFLKYTDVKPKEDKKQSVNELANQKGVLSKINGWKIYHLTTQMEDAVDLEDNVYNQMSKLLDFIETGPVSKKALSVEEDRIVGKVTDLIKGNLQRSKIVQDQVCEVKQQIIKVIDHKPHVRDIIGKYVSKRPIKKKN